MSLNHTYGNTEARITADKFFATAINRRVVDVSDILGLVEQYIKEAKVTETIIDEICMFSKISDSIIWYAFNARRSFEIDSVHQELCQLRRDFCKFVKPITHRHVCSDAQQN